MRSSLLKRLSFLFIAFICLLSLPGYGQEEDDEQLIEEIQRSHTKRAEAAQKISTFDPHSEIKKLGYSELNAKAFTDVKVLEVLKKMLAQSDLKNLPREEVKAMILLKLNPSVQDFLNEHPALLEIAIDFMRDDKALVSMIDIFIRKSDLTKYAFIYLLLFIQAWLFRKIFFRKTWGRLKRYSLGAVLDLSVTGFALTTFYKLFQNELTPLIKIISRHL